MSVLRDVIYLSGALVSLLGVGLVCFALVLFALSPSLGIWVAFGIWGILLQIVGLVIRKVSN